LEIYRQKFPNSQYEIQLIKGTGTGGAVAPNKIIGKQVKVTVNTKILENSPGSGALPRPHYTPHIRFSKNTYWIKLYFQFDCLHFTNFCSPTKKLFPRLCN